LTVKAGTLGAGLEATVGVNDFLGFRFGVNMMSAGPSLDLQVRYGLAFLWCSCGSPCFWRRVPGDRRWPD
jgi:hypothetical protein